MIAYFVLKVSWLADDAYITLRTVDNALHGFGLRWNVIERVQVYTHPLWMLVLLPFKVAFSSSILALMVPCWVATMIALPLLLRSARTPMGVVAALAVLALSQSFIDFSSSGLENPLTHLLLACMFLSLPSEAGGVWRLSVCFGLLLLNRLDVMPLIAPLVAFEIWSTKDPRRILKLALALSPLTLWLIFSTAYYGSPFPNTYFAKVAAGIPTSRLLLQGVRYFIDVFLYEPLTISLVLGGIAIGAGSRKVDRAASLMALGMSLHLLYVFKVGGDFMNARFLTPDVVAAAWIAARAADRVALAEGVPARVMAYAAALAAVGISTMLLASDFHSFASRKAPSIRPSSITDERQFYFSATGLWGRWWEYLNKGAPFEVAHSWADLGRRLRAEHSTSKPFVHDNMGFLGYFAGPRVHIVDGLGLTDAFVARLPVDNFWTAGHGGRVVPTEYTDSLSRGQNLFADERLHQMFDDVALVTRSKYFFSVARFRAAWRLNTSFYRDWAEREDRNAPKRREKTEQLVRGS
jgi:arabinofuranosyltransferase